MTIREHEDKYIHINKEKLGTMLFFGLIGIGLILVSIWSGIEARNNTIEEGREWCFEHSRNLSIEGLNFCESIYLPLAAFVGSLVLFLIGIISIIVGLSEVNNNE